MAFRFVHTADIHLDSPLRSLSLRDPEIADLIGNATRQSFSKIIDLCLDEAVDALMIAGDLYDGELRSMKSAAFLGAEMRRLAAGGIRAFVIRGNHDAESVITRHLSLPDNVHVFSGRAEAVPIEGKDVVVHGVSFSKPHITDSLLPKYRPPVEGRINIGLLHTSLAGSSRHDVYAPCGLSDLADHGFDYWGLGHIHQREVHTDKPSTVVMPGIPQGRHINEAGPKSVTLVEIHDNGQLTIEERFTSVAQFERVAVNIAGAHDWSPVLQRIETALGEAADMAMSDHIVARLEISGSTPLASRLRRDEDLLIEEARQSTGTAGKVFIEAVDLQTHVPDRATQSDGNDPLTELRALMDPSENNPEGTNNLDLVREKARELIGELQRQLPGELRDRFGDSEDGLSRVVDEFIGEGTETLLSRFEADRTGQ